MSIKDLSMYLDRSFLYPEIPDPFRWAPGFVDCGLLQRTGRRPARLQAEKNFFTGKAGEKMI